MTHFHSLPDFNLGKKHADPLLRLTESNFEGISWIAFPAVKREVMCECERVYASIPFYILMLFISWIISNIIHLYLCILMLFMSWIISIIIHLYLCQTCGSCEYINRTEWCPMHHFFRVESREATCVLYHSRRYCVCSHYHYGQCYISPAWLPTSGSHCPSENKFVLLGADRKVM